jgi:hypothetical protein
MLDDLQKLNHAELEKIYKEREREPDMVPLGTWMPKDTQNL